MAKYLIEYLPIAYDDLEDIFQYIAADDQTAAASLLDEMDRAISHLGEFPDMGVRLNNKRLDSKGYRMLVVNDYLIFYVFIYDVIEIRRILSSKRKYMNLLKKLV